MYIRKQLHPPRRKRSLLGFGDFTDADQCSTIPIGDAYRRPGNYCATPDGGMTTFNSDGSTYRAPGAVDPDPAHPAGATSSSSSGGIWDAIAGALLPRPPTTVIAPSSGMSTTTMVVIGGGIVLLAVVLARR